MRFLQVGKAHTKNEIGFKLLAKEANATIDTSYDPSIEYDLVWIPEGFYTQISNAKRILYGPHNFVFPNGPWLSNMKFSNSIYTSLSVWIKDIYSKFGSLCMHVEPIPFPVEVEKFKPSNQEKTIDCFLYFKARSRHIQRFFQQYLEMKGISYINIEYGKYKEEDYIEILKSVKFGIWIGSHESQGFALQEALCANVPLLVYNVKTMHDEVNHEGNHSYMEYEEYNLTATSATYWDDRCGIIICELNEIEQGLEDIKNNFSPREFILETLSSKVCWANIQKAFARLDQ